MKKIQKITDEMLVKFYVDLFRACDEADQLDDEFEAMGAIQDIVTIESGSIGTVPDEQRLRCMDKAIKSMA